MKRAVVILPTYNEKGNIIGILDAILQQRIRIYEFQLDVLVVDDSSPDGTGDIVAKYAQLHSGIYLLRGKKEGLGVAYIRGFKYALHNLSADVVLEMDADFSHNPNDIPRFLEEIDEGYDFVIGSRYIQGGSIPENWSRLRKANSKWGNIFARFVAGLSNTKDCTSGYRAISANLLRKIDLNRLNVKGYAFQISLLHQALKQGGRIKEVPIQFVDRIRGKSKIRFKDVREFVISSFLIRWPFLRQVFITMISVGVGAIIYSFLSHTDHILGFRNLVTDLMLLVSFVLTVQGIFTLFWMMFAWEDPDRTESNKSPSSYLTPKYSFTALIPVRNEEKVIGDTLRSISNIDYPEELKEVIAICRIDDRKTIEAVQKTLVQINKPNIKLHIFGDLPINKPHGLNVGLTKSKNDVVVVFDAEDEPHGDIYNIINTVMLRDNADVVQSGVQLMNLHSPWFSMLNVLEYFFWFKSALHFFSLMGVVPLGGNTYLLSGNG